MLASTYGVASGRITVGHFALGDQKTHVNRVRSTRPLSCAKEKRKRWQRTPAGCNNNKKRRICNAAWRGPSGCFMFMNHAADPGIIRWEAYGHFPNGACKTLESFAILKEASISLVLLILVLKSDSDWMKIPYAVPAWKD